MYEVDLLQSSGVYCAIKEEKEGEYISKSWSEDISVTNSRSLIYINIF